MNFPKNDPKGYYATLGVGGTASSVEIKHAYHVRARELHPDHNAATNATEIFQTVTEAYHVLSDSEQRAWYDTLCQGANVQGAERRKMSCRLWGIILVTCAFFLVFMYGLYVLSNPAGPVPLQNVQGDHVVVVRNARILPAVGEFRHVGIDRLRVYQAADKSSPLLTILERRATVQVVGLTDSEDWVEIFTPGRLKGFTQIGALFSGPGDGLSSQRCWDGFATTRPVNGAVLLRRSMGTRPLDILNRTDKDVLVKLKSPEGLTHLAVFIQAGTEVTVPRIPETVPLRAVFASGRDYSPVCMAFLTDFSAYALSWRLTPHDKSVTSLTVSLNFAVAMPVERFLSDGQEIR